MATIRDITRYLENTAPAAYQESYDNCGLITGNEDEKVTGILICLDVTEAVIEEATDRNCNLVIAHHPIIFKGLKKLTGKNYVERTVVKAIRNDIAVYALHTSLDKIKLGVNRKIGQKLQLGEMKILLPSTNTLSKLVTFAPVPDSRRVLDALHTAGAGNIGNYKDCGFWSKGTGTFTPNEDANPEIGQANRREEVEEHRIEVIFPSYLQHTVVAALKEAHPYEEVAYYLQSLENANQEVGSGMMGVLEAPLSETDFLAYLKEKMNLKMVRHTSFTGRKVKKVAFCGGSGSFLTGQAIRQKADAFVTADMKYHDFFEADNRLLIADIGHYESEVFTKDLIFEILSEKFANIALNLSKVDTNPISYL